MRFLAAISPFLLATLFHASADAAHSTVTSTVTIMSTRQVIVTTTLIATLRHQNVATTTTQTTTPTATNSLQPSGSALYSGDEFQLSVLNSTNYYRNEYQAHNVTWNDTLANYAQNYAQECLWQHSGGPYGENLASNFANPTLAIDAWGNEESAYSYASPGFSEDTGHFTQLVWSNSTTVGCGAAWCGEGSNATRANGWYIICEYWPRGNVEGEYQSMVKTPVAGNDGIIGLTKGSAVSGIGDAQAVFWKAVGAALGCLLLALEMF